MRLGRSFVNPSENFKEVVAITSLRTAKKKIKTVFIGSAFVVSRDSCFRNFTVGAE